MAFRVFLCCKSASKSLNQSFLQSPSSTFFPAFNSFFGVIRSFSSRSSNPWNHPQVHPLRSMMTSSHPRYDVAEAVSAALEPDSRVPATVTTGFLGSGKLLMADYTVEPHLNFSTRKENCCYRERVVEASDVLH